MSGCSCGDSSRPHINHRVRISCWTYIGHDRVNIGPDGHVLNHFKAARPDEYAAAWADGEDQEHQRKAET